MLEHGPGECCRGESREIAGAPVWRWIASWGWNLGLAADRTQLVRAGLGRPQGRKE